MLKIPLPTSQVQEHFAILPETKLTEKFANPINPDRGANAWAHVKVTAVKTRPRPAEVFAKTQLAQFYC